MSIPISVANHQDVVAAFDRLEAVVRGALEPLAAAGTPLVRTSTQADEAERRATTLDRTKRTDTYVVDAGGGRRAEVEFRWDGGAPSMIDWSLRELGPGAATDAPGCLVGVAVALGWVVLLVTKYRVLVDMSARALALALMGGLLTCVVTTLAAMGLAGGLYERLCRRLRPGRCRAASEFTSREVRPAVTRAIEAFLAPRAPNA